MKPIIRHYFRREGEDWNESIGLWGSIPIAGVVGKTWLDTLRSLSTLPANTDDDDYETRWVAYQTLRRAKLISVSFPEYLRAQGVSVPEQLTEPVEDLRKPEMLRFIRQFTYPSNTVNPASANAQVSAASWVLNERIDKRFYFDEPGFIVGVHTTRPKVYRGNQAGHASSNLRDARTWLPNEILQDAPQETLSIHLETDSPADGDITPGVLPDVTDSYAHDLSGLFVLGDQFVVGGGPTVDLPSDDGLNSIYPDQTSVRALFTDAGNSHYHVYCDGMLSLTLTGQKRLTTAV